MFPNFDLKPMLLKEKSKIFQDKDFIYEIKFDGIRAFIYASKNIFKIVSRNGIDLTDNYPELKEIQRKVLNSKVIFDGEIIALDEKGFPSFSLLQKRMRSKKNIEEIPVFFVAFDLVYENRDLTKLPLVKRKNILRKYKDTKYFIKSKVYDDGISLFQKVKKIGLEGVVCKRLTSKYCFNERSDDWIKVKNIKVDNFIVHGFLEKTNTYSLFLGEYKDKKLNYVGKVSVNKKHEIMGVLKKMKRSYNQFVNCLEEAIYVEPIHYIRVRFLEKTKLGRLRHAEIDQ